MLAATRTNTQEIEWSSVSARKPCVICNATAGCHSNSDGAFVSCARTQSDWPLTTGAWLHDVEHGPCVPRLAREPGGTHENVAPIQFGPQP